MNKLSDDILDTIYRFKHNLEFTSVLSELLQAKIFTKYKLSLAFVLMAKYCNENGIMTPCVDIGLIDCTPIQLLTVIKKNKYYNIFYIH